jgi:hypothetical protein
MAPSAQRQRVPGAYLLYPTVDQNRFRRGQGRLVIVSVMDNPGVKAAHQTEGVSELATVQSESGSLTERPFRLRLRYESAPRCRHSASRCVVDLD